MLPSCLGGHATPSHEKDDRAPSDPPSTGQRPPIPAMAPGSPALPCSLGTRTNPKLKEEEASRQLEYIGNKES